MLYGMVSLAMTGRWFDPNMGPIDKSSRPTDGETMMRSIGVPNCVTDPYLVLKRVGDGHHRDSVVR